MNRNRKIRHLWFGIVLIIFLLPWLIVSCTSKPTDLPVVSTETAPVPSETVMQTPPEIAVATNTPIPNKVILLATDQANAGQFDLLKTLLADLASSSGLQFEARTSLPVGDLSSEIKIIVAIAPDPGVADLISAAPETQFLAVGIDGLTSSPNLTQIQAGENFAAQRSFLAAYIGVITTTDWRVGILLPTNSSSASVMKDAFSNGAYYYCNFCNPVYPPYFAYPQIAEMASAADWQTAADLLIGQSVQTIYVPAEASSPELLKYLSDKDIMMLGDQPPTNDVKAHWIATLSSTDLEQEIRTLWPDLISGKGGTVVAPSLSITDVDQDVLSAGKMRLVEDLIQGLSKGLLDPLSVN